MSNAAAKPFVCGVVEGKGGVDMAACARLAVALFVCVWVHGVNDYTVVYGLCSCLGFYGRPWSTEQRLDLFSK